MQTFANHSRGLRCAKVWVRSQSKIGARNLVAPYLARLVNFNNSRRLLQQSVPQEESQRNLTGNHLVSNATKKSAKHTCLLQFFYFFYPTLYLGWHSLLRRLNLLLVRGRSNLKYAIRCAFRPAI